jgi:hypothetical protein
MIGKIKEKIETLKQLKLLVIPGEKPAVVAGILIGPLVWLVALQVKFALVPFACWFGWKLALHTATLVALSFVVIAGVFCWRNWRAAGAEWPGETDSPQERTRFLALLGLGSAAFSFLAILGQGIANFLLNPCQ